MNELGPELELPLVKHAEFYRCYRGLLSTADQQYCLCELELCKHLQKHSQNSSRLLLLPLTGLVSEAPLAKPR